MWRKVHFHPDRMVRLSGRRGTFLILFGIIWVAFGLSLFAFSTSRFNGLGVASDYLNSPLWGLLWATSGVIGIWSGARRRRNPVASDKLGFNAILIPPMIWLAFFALSLLAACASIAVSVFATGGPVHLGDLRAITGVIIWSTAVGVTLLIADWPDPMDADLIKPLKRRR